MEIKVNLIIGFLNSSITISEKSYNNEFYVYKKESHMLNSIETYHILLSTFYLPYNMNINVFQRFSTCLVSKIHKDSHPFIQM